MKDSYLDALARRMHAVSKSGGQWDTERDPAEVLMLIVSGAVEALEETRGNRPLNEQRTEWVMGPDRTRNTPHTIGTENNRFFLIGAGGRRRPMTPELWLELGYHAKPEGVPSELAGIIIRVLDACAAWDIDIESAILARMTYNETRERLYSP